MIRILRVVTWVLVMSGSCAIVAAEAECEAVHTFLKHYSKLLVSLPLHTNPVFNLCTTPEAVKTYQAVLENYTNMTNTAVCQKYLAHNRMHVYETIYSQVTNLWASANCAACVNAPNETAEFMNLSKKLDACLHNSTNPCVSCDDDYQHLQRNYAQLEKAHGLYQLCFDIADQMNQTRQAWSVEYDCCKNKKRSMTIFAAVGSVTCALPVLFYSLIYVLTKRHESRNLALLTSSSGDEAPRSRSNRMTNSTTSTRQPQISPRLGRDQSYVAAGSNGECSALRPTTAKESNENNLDITEGNLIDASDEQSFNVLAEPLVPNPNDINDDKMLS